MDLNDIWQEHRRWILGVLGGLIAFWIGTSIVGSVFGADDVEGRVRTGIRSVRSLEVYERDDREAAAADAERLAAAERQLRAAMEFEPPEEFLLDGKGDVELHFDGVQRRVRRALIDKAQQLAVDLGESALQWSPPVSRDEIEQTLWSLCVLEQACSRLLDAGERVRSTDPDAIGVQGIDQLRVESLSKTTARAGARSRRGQPVPSDRVTEYQVSFKVRADIATWQLFLEKCRAETPHLTMTEDLQVKPGRSIGDPLVIQGRIAGIRIRDV